MAINISSLPTQLIIGNQNWSQYISFSSGIQIGYPEYAMGSGLMIVQGTINLEFRADFVGLPSSPVYKLNPNQWRRGQTISIAVNNVVLPCSGGQLFLLKSPQYPNRDADGIAKISLSVGCRLALESFPPEPSRNVAGVIAGQPTNRALIISRILNYINVPNTLGSIPYPIDYSLPKTDGNWIQFAGKIADSGGHYLRCRTDGVVVSEPIQLSFGSSVRSYLIGRDEKLWEAIGDIAEQPLELTIVTGVVQDVTPIDNAAERILERIVEPYGVVFPEISPANPLTFPVEKSRTTEKIDRFTDRIVATKKFFEAYGVIFPDISPANPNANPALKRQIETIYFLENGLVYATKISEFIAYGVLFPEISPANPNVNLVLKSQIETEWLKVRDGLWNKTTTSATAYGVLFPDQQPLNPNTNLVGTPPVTISDTSGAPTSIGDISENVTSDRQIKAEVYATQLAADPFRARQRTIPLDYAVSVPQLSNYGALINRALTGRAFGWGFGGVLDIGLLPFQQVAVTFEGLIYYLRVDALQYAISGTEAYLLWNGIEVGTAAASTPNNIIFPLQIPLGVANIQSISGSQLVYDTLGTALTELVSGGDLRYTPPFTALGLNLVSGGELIWNPLGNTNLELISGGTLENTPPSGLLAKTIAYYKMDEASGVRFDSHTNSRNLAGSSFSAVSGTTGLIGDCYPSSQSPVIQNPLGDFDSFDLNIVSFLGISFWFYPNGSPSGTDPLFRLGDNAAPCQIDLRDQDFPEFNIYDNAGTQYTVTDVDGTVAAQWNLVIIEINTDTGDISVQVNDGTITTNATGITNYYAMSLTGFLFGESSTDEMLFYNSPLTTQDRTDLYNSGNGLTYPF